MTNRRNLLIAFSAALFTPGSVLAQTEKPPVVIGWLSLNTRETQARAFAEFKEGLAALGWKEGSQIIIEARWADGQNDRLPQLAQELAAKKPALIVASGGGGPARTAAKVTPKIPIVLVFGSDPVAGGLVKSLARPGGMITGLSGFLVEQSGKYLELLVAAAPKVKRVGFLVESTSQSSAFMENARRSATQYQVEARFAEVSRPEEIEPALSRLAKEGVQGLVVLPSVPLQTERRRILEFALAQHWPVVSGPLVYAESGALLSYGADTVAQHRRAAYYVDRILKGAKPADLPIEQPMNFELVVNMKTAKALGLTMPPEIMVRATKVIQ